MPVGAESFTVALEQCATVFHTLKKVLKNNPTSASILVSPMFDKDNKAVIGSDLVNWILEDRLNCRVQIQLHKILSVR